ARAMPVRPSELTGRHIRTPHATHRTTSVASASVVLVDLLDEARELVSGAAHRPDRLLVVHPDGPEQADGAKNAVGEAIGRADQRDIVEGRVLEVTPDAHEGPSRIECLAEDLKELGSLLERGKHAAVEEELPVRNL